LENKYKALKANSSNVSGDLEEERQKLQNLIKMNNAMEEEIKSLSYQAAKMDSEVSQVRQEMLEKESFCLSREETLKDELEQVQRKLTSKRKRADEADELQMQKVTLEMRVEELEVRIRKMENDPHGAGDSSNLTPKTDRKLSNVQGIYGSFYGMINFITKNCITRAPLFSIFI
jgi:chromosome segregation ATPase